MTERTDETPGSGASAASASARPSHPGRWLAGGALALALIAILFVVFTRDSSHTYRFVFENAGQLVTGDIVRIGGTAAGEVTGIELTDDGRAEIEVTVSDDFAPLHSGTSATIRAPGLIGTANRYVDVSPAPNFKEELPDGATIGGDNTTSIVELDEFFNTLNPRTRKGLDHVIQGFADWYEGQEEPANRSSRYFPPALVAGNKFFSELVRDSDSFAEFLLETNKAMGGLAERRDELSDLITNTGTTFDALSADTEALREVLVQLPPALRQGSELFEALPPALDDLEEFVVASEPAARELGPFMKRFRPFVEESVPTFEQLTRLFNSPGPGNDLYDTMRDLPPLAKSANTAFPRAQRALRQSAPIFGVWRAYTPELVGWFRSFAGAMAPYDANGHYTRTMPIFDAFNYVDDPEGGHLDPKAPPARGNSPYLKHNYLRRCPGTAAPTPADGSTPFIDSGPLSNPDCDPSQIVGGTP